jgi:hypothetical protein
MDRARRADGSGVVNIEEAGYVLAVAAAYDNRPPSQAVATTWAYDLKDITQADAIDAVREHYRNNPDVWIKPGHVVEIVKRHRSKGLANASRVENAVIEALDPDDPDYLRKYQEAIQNARRIAAERPDVIPARVAVGGRVPTAEEWVEKAARGKAIVQPVLDSIAEKKVTEDPHQADIPDNLRRAREVARQYKRDRDKRPEQQAKPLAGAVGDDPTRLVSQFKQIPEKATTE